VGTTTNGSGLELYVYQSEVAHGVPTTVVLSSPQATSYYGGKNGVTTSGVTFGFGTDVQQWDAFGVPSGWANNIAGVGINTNGDSGAMPAGVLADAFIGLGFDVQLDPGQSTTITVNYAYGETTPPQQTNDGDFNDDGIYDCLDVDALVGDIAAGNNTASFDLTGDGLVDTADRDAWLLEAGEANIGPGRAYKLGDANLDAVVDGSDFGIWNSNKFTSVAEWCSGDFTADGVVDGSDFGAWNSNKFTSSDSATVPEPSALAGFALLLTAIGVRGGRRSRHAPA
jgi:hypothetical protein